MCAASSTVSFTFSSFSDYRVERDTGSATIPEPQLIIVFPSAAALSSLILTPSPTVVSVGSKWRITLQFLEGPEPRGALNTTRVTTVFLPLLLGSIEESMDNLCPTECLIPNVPPKEADVSTSTGSISTGITSIDVIVP